MTEQGVIPKSLEAVYAKWSDREPKGSSPTKGSCKSNEMVDRIVKEGKQRWINKFSDSIKPLGHRKARQKGNRNRVMAISTEEVTSKVIAQFKCTPIVTPESLVVGRPFMGSCCTCLPLSQMDFINSDTQKKGLQNVLSIETEIRGSTFVERNFGKLVYVLRRKTIHKYTDVSLAVLMSPRVLEAVDKESKAAAADKRGKSSPGVTKKPKHLLDVMKATISNSLIRFTAWFLLKFLTGMLQSIVVHKGQLEMVKKASERGLPVIYLPLHKSHLDYILITFILWHFDIRAPHVAAGNNLDIPVFGKLMKGLGGFFIRRKLDKHAGKKDLIYRAILHSYMQELLQSGESMEFFIEGGRTRSGKALPPKLGLMSVVVETLTKGLVEDAYIVPISISYDKIMDGNFKNEQMGLPKKKESFLGAVRAIWGILSNNFGSVRVDFTQPFSLKEYVQTCQCQLSTPAVSNVGSDSESHSDSDSLPPSPIPTKTFGSSTSLYGTDIVEEDQRNIIQSLGEHIVFNCVHSTALMCTNVLAFILLTKHRQGVELSKLVMEYDWLINEMKTRKRDVGFCGLTQEVIHYASALLGPELVQIEKTKCDTIFQPKVTLPDVFELSYYSNSVISVFLMESIVACSVIYNCDVSVGTLDEGYSRGGCSASRDDILQTAAELCQLLKYEFTILAPCQRLEEVLADQFDELVTMEIIKIEESQSDCYSTFDRGYSNRLSSSMSWADELDEPEDSVTVTCKVNMNRQDCMEKLEFLLQVLAPLLESYYHTACQINKVLHTELPEDDFTKMIHKAAISRVHEGVASYGESASLDSIRNSIKAFQDIKIIDIYYAGNLRMVELHDHFEVKDRLNDYIDTLESLRQ